MIRKFFYATTLLFWLAVIGFWLDSLTAPTASPPSLPPAPLRIPLNELATHKTEQDCWMAIEGSVYDVTPYLPEHPSQPSVILPWCGREASEGYRTKGKGRSHSANATALLQSYRIGELDK